MRHYSEDEVETLQTVAMVLAEMVASGDLVSAEELREADGIALLPLRLNGVRLNGGLGLGHAVMHEPRIVVKRLIAEDVPLELDRLDAALAGMYTQLDTMLADDALAHGGEHREIRRKRVAGRCRAVASNYRQNNHLGGRSGHCCQFAPSRNHCQLSHARRERTGSAYPLRYGRNRRVSRQRLLLRHAESQPCSRCNEP